MVWTRQVDPDSDLGRGWEVGEVGWRGREGFPAFILIVYK